MAGRGLCLERAHFLPLPRPRFRPSPKHWRQLGRGFCLTPTPAPIVGWNASTLGLMSKNPGHLASDKHWSSAVAFGTSIPPHRASTSTLEGLLRTFLPAHVQAWRHPTGLTLGRCGSQATRSTILTQSYETRSHCADKKTIRDNLN